MAAYTYFKNGLELEIFRVDKPRGRWLAFGVHEGLDGGFNILIYLDKLPKGCSRMDKEVEPYRQQAMEEVLQGYGQPLFPVTWEGG